MEQTESLQLDQSNIIYFKTNENLGIEKISLPRSKVFQQITFLAKSICLSNRMEQSRGI